MQRKSCLPFEPLRSHREIAAILKNRHGWSMSQEAVRDALYRAQKKLRARLEGRELGRR